MKLKLFFFSFLLFIGVELFSQSSFYKIIEFTDRDANIGYSLWSNAIFFHKDKIYSFERIIIELNKNGEALKANLNNAPYRSAAKNEKGFIAIGNTDLFTPTPKGSKIFIRSLDLNNNTQSQVMFTGFLSDFQVGQAISILPNKELLYAGNHRYATKNYHRGLFLKTDANYKAILAMEVVDTASSVFKKVQTDKNGNIYLMGVFNTKSALEEVLVIKLDKTGKQLWSKAFGGYSLDGAYDGLVSKDGSIYIAGQTISHAKHGQADGFVLKLDSNGKQLWAKVYGGARVSGFWKIKEANNGDIYALGRNREVNRTCKGMKCSDVYLVQLDTSGTVRHAVTLGVSDKWDVGYAFDINENNEIIIGSHSMELDNDVLVVPSYFYSSEGIKGFCNSKIDSSKGIDVVFTEYKGSDMRNIPLFKDSVVNLYDVDAMQFLREDTYCSTVSLPESEQSNKTFSVFPNPATKELNITWDNALNQRVNLKLYTMQGQLVLEQEMRKNEKLDISLLQNGTYILLIKSKGIVQREIIVVE